MNEPDFNNANNSQPDFESYLRQFRPVETSASIAETFYQAGWRAAVAPNKSLENKSARGSWTTFLSGAACGLLPMLILFVANGQTGFEPVVSKSDEPLKPIVQQHDEVAIHVGAETSGDAEGPGRSSPIVSRTPTAVEAFADALMLSSWLPRLQIGESSLTSNSSSVLRFRPLTNDVMDLANIDQRASASSTFLTTANESVHSVDPREPLTARSSTLNEDLLRELFL